ACRRRRRDLYEAIERELAGVYAVVIDELEAILDAGSAIGDLGEIVFAEDLLVFEAEGAMVGGDYLQVIVFESVPEFWLVLFGAERRCEDVLRALEVRPREIIDGEQEVLRAGFGEGGNTAIAGLANLVKCVLGR